MLPYQHSNHTFCSSRAKIDRPHDDSSYGGSYSETRYRSSSHPDRQVYHKTPFHLALMGASSPLQAAASAARSNGAIKAEPEHESSPLSPHSPPLTSTSRGPSRDSVFGPSPESIEGSYNDRGESRISVKRACNECRQQKVRRSSFPNPP